MKTLKKLAGKLILSFLRKFVPFLKSLIIGSRLTPREQMRAYSILSRWERRLEIVKEDAR